MKLKRGGLGANLMMGVMDDQKERLLTVPEKACSGRDSIKLYKAVRENNKTKAISVKNMHITITQNMIIR